MRKAAALGGSLPLKLWLLLTVLATGCGNHEQDGVPSPGRGPAVGESPGSAGQLRVPGVLTAEGVECPALRGLDGKLYTLAGDIGSFVTGDTVLVVGRTAELSTCMQGTTIAVDSIARVRPTR